MLTSCLGALKGRHYKNCVNRRRRKSIELGGGVGGYCYCLSAMRLSDFCHGAIFAFFVLDGGADEG